MAGGAELKRFGNAEIVGMSRGITTRNRSASIPASITVTRSSEAQIRLVTDGRPKMPIPAELFSPGARLRPEMITCCKYSGVATGFASHTPGCGLWFYDRSDARNRRRITLAYQKKFQFYRETPARLDSCADKLRPVRSIRKLNRFRSSIL